MTEELKQKIDKIVRDYYTSPKALALYRNLKGLVYDVAEEATKELEKENAELKKALKNDNVCKCSHYLNFKDLEAELTKAKELLQFVSEYEDMTCYADELEEIKQFLKECK